MTRVQSWLSLSLAVLQLAAVSFGQTNADPPANDANSQQQPSAAQPAPKKKHVYTDEDMVLLKRKGGVSVVGSDNPAPPSGDHAQDPFEPRTASSTKASGPLQAPQADCLTYSWAASVEAAVLQLDIPLDRNFWLMKGFGGSVCRSNLGALPALVNGIAGDYVLDDGSKVHLATNAVFGSMPKVDDLMAAVQGGKTYVFVWRGHPYLVERVQGVDRQGAGSHVYSLSKIMLVDPYLGTHTEFTDKDSPSQIDTAFSITAQQK